ncbi:MAG TPA: hypothetical protein DCW90_16305 [Lachnospiraceae bacterium]|nr:hypothetical protein [uncultured Lachnoclostridium sp.]HAU86988.1 hypothetical protein [Lachnospiraceae bacterium]
MSGSWAKRTDNKTYFNSSHHNSLRAAKADDKVDALTDWLGRLSLLYEVPFAYLAPSELLIPRENIRFFYYDTNWVRALLDGAFSIGRNAAIDDAEDDIFMEQVIMTALQNNANIRRRLQGKEERKTSEWEVMSKECTGFLLRSELVNNFRGLEFVAYGESGEVLTALRLEKIGKEVLLGIYAGVIKKLEIKEPPEGLQFGFHQMDGKRIKNMRNLSDGSIIYENGKMVPVEVATREYRVIDYKKTAQNIENCKSVFPEGGKKVSSAHIAVELIQNASMIEIKEGSN